MDEIKKRINEFLIRGDVEPYPEDPIVTEPATAKVARALSGILTFASYTGAPSIDAGTINQVRLAHTSGLTSFIFREQGYKLIYPLVNFLFHYCENFSFLDIKSLITGSYYMMWEMTRERLIFPNKEKEDHAATKQGVIKEEAPQELLEKLSLYLPFAAMAYRDTPAQIQWVLHTYPARDEPITRTARFVSNVLGGGEIVTVSRNIRTTNKFHLIGAKLKAEKLKPAFFIAGTVTEEKTIVISIRGTDEVADLLTVAEYSTDMETMDFLGDVKYQVHKGFLEAAKGLLEVIDFQGFKDHKYNVILTGHSLGGGVAILLGCLAVNKIPGINIQVIAYATPPCVDPAFAMLCSENEYLKTHLQILNYVERDDIVSRLSAANAKQFLIDIQSSRASWGFLLREEVANFRSRMARFWEPLHRRLPAGVVVSTSSNKRMRAEIQDQLVIPGKIVHSYLHRSTPHAALVDYRFLPLQEIEPYQNMIDDHRLVTIQSTLRNLFAVREAESTGAFGPVWESINDHVEKDKRKVTCAVCKYFVGSTVMGEEGMSELRGTNHCYNCGLIVCENCSGSKISIPSIGILNQVRVCDHCYNTTITPPPPPKQKRFIFF